MAMHTVVSIATEPVAYHDWQARILALSHARVGQPGPLTCLVATTDAAPCIPGAGVLAHAPGDPDPETGDRYPMYNRLAGLAAWLATTPPAEETICILDPDCLFRASLGDCAVQRGHPVAQPIGYLDCAAQAALLAPYGDPAALAPVSMPWLIHREDLRVVLPRWMDYTRALRADPRTREAFGWITDMWGYCLAAAEAGLRHEPAELAWMITGHAPDLPLVHYCYPGEVHVPGWTWDKRYYRPWDRVPPWPTAAPAPLQEVLTRLDELARFERGRRGRTA
jgi:hypothetical protein